jgi:hypothetical protein
METPLVVETLGVLQPVERDPFLIGLGTPAPSAPVPVPPQRARSSIPHPPRSSKT